VAWCPVSVTHFFCTQTQWTAVCVCVCDTVSKLCTYLDTPTADVIGAYLSVLILKIRAVFINVHDMKYCVISRCKKDASWEADSTSACHNLPHFCRTKKLPWAKRMHPNFIKCFIQVFYFTCIFLRRNVERFVWRRRACACSWPSISIWNFCRILITFGIAVLDKICPSSIYRVTVIFYWRRLWICTCGVHRLWPLLVKFCTGGLCNTV
jgi:hypothetical protein